MIGHIGAFMANTFWVENSWMIEKVAIATWETLYMVVISTALSYVFGLPLGVIMVTTADWTCIRKQRIEPGSWE